MKTLLVGYKAADLTPELLEGDVTCHVLDIYHRHAIEKVHHAKVVCSAHLPEGPWDLIRFKTGPKLMSGELSLDLLQEISQLLRSGQETASPLSEEGRPEKKRLERSGNSRSVAKAYAEAMRKTAKSRASRRTERDEKKLGEM